MRHFSEIMHKYNKNWLVKSQMAESILNILVDGGEFGDYLTFFFSFLCKLLERKKTENK